MRTYGDPADAEMQSTGGTIDLAGDRTTQQTKNIYGNTVSSSHTESQLERRPAPRFAATGQLRRAGSSGSGIRRTCAVRARLGRLAGSAKPSAPTAATRSLNGKVASCASLVVPSACLEGPAYTTTARGILSTVSLSKDGMRVLVWPSSRTTRFSWIFSGSTSLPLNGSRSCNSCPLSTPGTNMVGWPDDASTKKENSRRSNRLQRPVGAGGIERQEVRVTTPALPSRSYRIVKRVRFTGWTPCKSSISANGFPLFSTRNPVWSPLRCPIVSGYSRYCRILHEPVRTSLASYYPQTSWSVTPWPTDCTLWYWWPTLAVFSGLVSKTGTSYYRSF